MSDSQYSHFYYSVHNLTARDNYAGQSERISAAMFEPHPPLARLIFAKRAASRAPAATHTRAAALTHRQTDTWVNYFRALAGLEPVPGLIISGQERRSTRCRPHGCRYLSNQLISWSDSVVSRLQQLNCQLQKACQPPPHAILVYIPKHYVMCTVLLLGNYILQRL